MSIDKQNLPLHVAITMDGNGRWAQAKNLPRTSGHNEGLHVAKRIVKASSDLGIKFLTLYVFSTENWKRAQQEVGFLMNLIHSHLCGELNFYKKNKIKINHIGDFKGLPESVQKDIAKAIEDTKDFTGMTVNLAINYGGRNEIVRGIKKIVDNNIKSENIDEKLVSQYMDMPESPDVDLLIRTGGEKRLSNYLLWHIPYAEQVYTDTLWPDYSNEEFYSNIEIFQHRNRRFGAEK
ncbi:polyprenyl diphosphate synthase [Treponema sp. Marseille-Q3903]|uniref:polyprenyl diphosphate synthase n=1 Tax=Treponema sp. Marseille-Q3903 TaxID=2766703 RepID=UPI0016526BB5|nr:polyprenyl diphosphate synthase [Treponema sp. Marseille-Q3903]MBC6713652.1 di-trans,poly-cis-decaprenylcistransferase [Treponema sp. Marseille-Q3903]